MVNFVILNVSIIYIYIETENSEILIEILKYRTRTFDLIPLICCFSDSLVRVRFDAFILSSTHLYSSYKVVTRYVK